MFGIKKNVLLRRKEDNNDNDDTNTEVTLSEMYFSSQGKSNNIFFGCVVFGSTL